MDYDYADAACFEIESLEADDLKSERRRIITQKPNKKYFKIKNKR
jgi:hypothetical protein